MSRDTQGTARADFDFVYRTITFFGPASQLCSTINFSLISRPYNPYRVSTIGLGCSGFARITNGISLISFPEGTKIFQFPSFAPQKINSVGRLKDGVSSFGDLRIKAYVRLPVAYRSLSRPSSPLTAKASTVHSY